MSEIFLFFLTIAFFIVLRWFIPFESKVDWSIKLLKTFGLLSVINLFWMYLRYRKPALGLIRKYTFRHSFDHLLGSQVEIQKELKTLIHVWTNNTPWYKKIIPWVKNTENDNKILLFVDDIDRCSEEKIIEIIDALWLMLDDPELAKKLMIVAAIDDRILKNAIRRKYENTDLQHISISEYIDKLFICGIKLGNLTHDETIDFFRELTREDRENEQLISEFMNYTVHSVKQPDTKKSAGNTSTTQPETLTPEETSEEKYKLHHRETTLLEEKLRLHPFPTPRQIRVFYYRYLIAKNLLSKQYRKADRKNNWLADDLHIFIELLILFTHKKTEDHDLITREKERTSQTIEEKIIPFLLPDTEVNREDYQHLLCILDTVIGY